MRSIAAFKLKDHKKSLRVFISLSICLLCLDSVAWGRAHADVAAPEPTPKAISVDGYPALALDYGNGVGFLITYEPFHSEPAFRFSVSHLSFGGFAGTFTMECGGFVWITRKDVAYTPDEHADKTCSMLKNRDGIGTFEVRREDVGDVEGDGGGCLYVNLKSEKNRFTGCFAYQVIPHKGHRVIEGSPIYQDSHQTEVKASGAIATKWVQLTFNNFDDAKQQFAQATAGVPFPLASDQNAGIAAAEKSGAAAEQAGNARQAFDTYVAALAGLPPGASGDAVDSLRESLIRVAAKLNPPPPVPEEAKRHLAYALTAIEEGKTSGDASKLNDAVDQLSQVLRVAPWRPEAYYNLGMVLEQQKQYAEAARNLKLYLLAAPSAQDAEAVQQKIYELEYKSGAR